MAMLVDLSKEKLEKFGGRGCKCWLQLSLTNRQVSASPFVTTTNQQFVGRNSNRPDPQNLHHGTAGTAGTAGKTMTWSCFIVVGWSPCLFAPGEHPFLFLFFGMTAADSDRPYDLKESFIYVVSSFRRSF